MDHLAIESIQFKNFKALVDTTLPLGPFTLIVGPNGSGKSTALQAIRYFVAGASSSQDIPMLQSAPVNGNPNFLPWLVAKWANGGQVRFSQLRWSPDRQIGIEFQNDFHQPAQPNQLIREFCSAMRVFALDPVLIERKSELRPKLELEATGFGLPVVLDRLRDDAPERFEALNKELTRWLPEFDQVLFDTPQTGHRQIKLRTRIGGHAIHASQLSQGTLLALTMLTLAYLPNPPSLIGLEEPDRGIHPRLLRDVRDALYRLAYPESFGESRPPVQVIATTQNPYFLDLFREHPEEIVISEKDGLEAKFVPLASHSHISEILADAPLGEVWYSGVLGGVPLPA